MRAATIAILSLSVVALAGCGSGAHFADKPHSPTPVNLTVYVSDSRVSVSPSSVGAGPVIFIITNQASRAVALTVRPATGGAPLATTAPINPQATSSVSVDFRPGDYTVDPSANANTLNAASISSTSIHIGHERRNGNNVLLQP
jgi:hypothetical protein